MGLTLLEFRPLSRLWLWFTLLAFFLFLLKGPLLSFFLFLFFFPTWSHSISSLSFIYSYAARYGTSCCSLDTWVLPSLVYLLLLPYNNYHRHYSRVSCGSLLDVPSEMRVAPCSQ